MYSVVLMAAMVTAPATPDFHRGKLFHRGGCSGSSGGYSESSGGCSGTYAAQGCSGGTAGYAASCNCGQQMRAVPCPTCPGGVRYVADSGNYGDGTVIAQNPGNVSNQFAVPDGHGGYRIVTSTGVYNGLPVIDPNAGVANQLPAPQAMPNKQ